MINCLGQAFSSGRLENAKFRPPSKPSADRKKSNNILCRSKASPIHLLPIWLPSGCYYLNLVDKLLILTASPGWEWSLRSSIFAITSRQKHFACPLNLAAPAAILAYHVSLLPHCPHGSVTEKYFALLFPTYSPQGSNSQSVNDGILCISLTTAVPD
jgi:hypothetical protein